jgi:hypothetical protein
MPYVDNLTEEKSRMLNELSGMAILVPIVLFRVGGTRDENDGF